MTPTHSHVTVSDTINPSLSPLVYKKNPQRYADLIKERLLDLLEQAFPNPMSVNDLAKYVSGVAFADLESECESCRYVECDDPTVLQYLIELEDKNLVKHLDEDGQQWTRMIVSPEEESTHRVILYKSVSELSSSFRPTIAIVTVNYFEKLAVDAMIENKITFVRHKAGSRDRQKWISFTRSSPLKVNRMFTQLERSGRNT